MRAAMEPLLRRLWELGAPGLVLSYPKEEGRFLGEANPLRLPAGRAQLVTRRGVRLVQTGLVRPEPGSPEPGSPEPGSPEPGSPEPGSPEPGSPEPGSPEPRPVEQAERAT
jgi:hypothetical protein